jgi:hypothetical protein
MTLYPPLVAFIALTNLNTIFTWFLDINIIFAWISFPRCSRIVVPFSNTKRINNFINAPLWTRSVLTTPNRSFFFLPGLADTVGEDGGGLQKGSTTTLPTSCIVR